MNRWPQLDPYFKNKVANGAMKTTLGHVLTTETTHHCETRPFALHV